MSALVLVTLVSFIHCACALTCYECRSGYGGWCDDPLLPLDPEYSGKSKVREKTCLDIHNACVKGHVSATDGKSTETVFLTRLT